MVTGQEHYHPAKQDYHPVLRIYDKVLADISKARPLTGEGYRVLLFLLGNVETKNLVPGPSETAKALGLHRQHTWQQYQQMLYDGYLVKDKDGYHIHPFICWRGSETNRNTAIASLLEVGWTGI